MSNKKKRKTPTLNVSKNLEGAGVDIAGLDAPVVELLPPIIDEPETEAVSTFTDPSQYKPLLENNELYEAIEELPMARFDITQRWYGEEFLPQYLKARNKLRRIANLP